MTNQKDNPVSNFHIDQIIPASDTWALVTYTDPDTRELVAVPAWALGHTAEDPEDQNVIPMVAMFNAPVLYDADYLATEANDGLGYSVEIYVGRASAESALRAALKHDEKFEEMAALGTPSEEW